MGASVDRDGSKAVGTRVCVHVCVCLDFFSCIPLWGVFSLLGSFSAFVTIYTWDADQMVH